MEGISETPGANGGGSGQPPAGAPVSRTRDGILGEVERRELSTVKPNPWNPNVVPEHIMASIREGLQTEGWLASHALLVWGTDETGKRRGVIIDGEHRWHAGQAIGMKFGPMVVLDGLTESQAKGLTIKLNQRRGSWDEDRLAIVLKEIEHELGADDLARALGFTDEALAKLLAREAEEAAVLSGTSPEPRAGGPAVLTGEGSGVRGVQFFFSPEDHAELIKLIAKIQEKRKIKTASETVLAALRFAAKACG